MRILEEFFQSLLKNWTKSTSCMPIPEQYTKRYQFIRFALSIKARSKPCVLKHFKGALEAGATVKELSYIFALTMREAAGADDCWTHDFIGDWREILEGNVSCSCCGDED